jgi:hypothetical protein
MFVKRKLREPAVFTFENRVGRRSTGSGHPPGASEGNVNYIRTGATRRRRCHIRRARRGPSRRASRGVERGVWHHWYPWFGAVAGGTRREDRGWVKVSSPPLRNPFCV